MSKIAFVVLAAGAASAFVVPTSRTPARTAPVMAAKPGGLAEFQQKAIATAVSLMLVAGPISFAPDAALAADGGAFSDSTTLTLAGRSAVMAARSGWAPRPAARRAAAGLSRSAATRARAAATLCRSCRCR